MGNPVSSILFFVLGFLAGGAAVYLVFRARMRAWMLTRARTLKRSVGEVGSGQKAEEAPARDPLPPTGAELKMRRFADDVLKAVLAGYGDPAFDVEKLSSRMALSRIQLNRKLKEGAGISPGALIKRVRLLNAARILSQEGESVSEAASRCGFSSASYFSSCFSEFFGMSPKEFAERRIIVNFNEFLPQRQPPR